MVVVIPYISDSARPTLSIIFLLTLQVSGMVCTVVLVQMQRSVGRAINRRASEVRDTNVKLGAVMNSSSKKLRFQASFMAVGCLTTVGVGVVLPAFARQSMPFVLAWLLSITSAAAVVQASARKTRRVSTPIPATALPLPVIADIPSSGVSANVE